MIVQLPAAGCGHSFTYNLNPIACTHMHTHIPAASALGHRVVLEDVKPLVGGAPTGEAGVGQAINLQLWSGQGDIPGGGVVVEEGCFGLVVTHAAHDAEVGSLALEAQPCASKDGEPDEAVHHRACAHPFIASVSTVQFTDYRKHVRMQHASSLQRM